MVRSEMFRLRCLLILVMVSVIFHVVPVPAQAESNFIVYATGPYEVWGGNETCPETIYSVSRYYDPQNCGYVFLGQATSTNSFNGNYINYVIATYSFISLDSVKMPDGLFMGEHESFLGNVYKTFKFNSTTGKLIGTLNDYHISVWTDYKIFGPPDGWTNSVGLPECCSSYPYFGVVASYKAVPIAMFKSLNKEESTYVDVPHTANGLPRPHMAGGLIRFNASESYKPHYWSGSLNKGITEYRWEFGDGTTAIRTDPIYDKIFYDPEIYVVNLTVTEVTGLSSEKYSEIIDLSLEPGDLIFLRSEGWTLLFNLIKNNYTHVGMYVGKINGIHSMIETTLMPTSGKDGVHLTNFPRWSYLYEKYADAVRVNVPDPDIRKRAIAFAMSKSINYHGYDLDSIFENAKQLDEKDAFEQAKVGLPYYRTDPSIAGKEYYCSELIWAAYYRASNGTINLSASYAGAIPPDGIFKSEYISNISSHHEHYPE